MERLGEVVVGAEFQAKVASKSSPFAVSMIIGVPIPSALSSLQNVRAMEGVGHGRASLPIARSGKT
jgi:hypothetical protein